jgi:sec-independent protein translocase protein TatA
MFQTIGAPELLIIAAVVLLLFGVGKVGRMGKDLGTSVKEFRRALKDEEAPAVEGTLTATVEQPASVQAAIAAPASQTAQVDAGNAAPRIF